MWFLTRKTRKRVKIHRKTEMVSEQRHQETVPRINREVYLEITAVTKRAISGITCVLMPKLLYRSALHCIDIITYNLERPIWFRDEVQLWHGYIWLWLDLPRAVYTTPDLSAYRSKNWDMAGDIHHSLHHSIWGEMKGRVCLVALFYLLIFYKFQQTFRSVAWYPLK